MKRINNNLQIYQNDEAVVGIVVTVLLIGLILSVMVMINTVYVPQWLEETEAAHMEDVSNQFTQLKHGLDLQTLVNDSTSISTYVSLGSREIPIFDAGRTFGTLQIDKDSFNISVEQWNISSNYSVQSDSIKYSSGNSYFVNQQYIYEAGALILGQGEANVLYGKPSLSVQGYGPYSIITCTIIDISGVSGKTFVSGYGTYPIYTAVTGFTPSFTEYITFNHTSNITIKTSYTNAWNKTIHSAFLNHFTSEHYTVTEVENEKIVIKFHDEPTHQYYDMRFKVVHVSGQISSGIAE